MIFRADPNRSATKYGTRGSELYSPQDATVAGTFAMLAAVNLGSATTWIRRFRPKKVAEALDLKSTHPGAIFSIGYSAEEPQRSPRGELQEIFHGGFPQSH